VTAADRSLEPIRQASCDLGASVDEAFAVSVARAKSKLSEAYRNDDFAGAVAPARTILDMSRSAPDVVDSATLVRANDVVTAHAIVPHIEIALDVRDAYFGTNIRGQIVNGSDREIESLVVQLTDADNRIANVRIERLAAQERDDVIELTSLRPGKPKTVKIAWVNLGAWGY
jgi:hypothetical protein